MQSSSLARVQVTVVATRGEELHVFGGRLERQEAIDKAKTETPYPDGTVFLTMYFEIDTTKPRDAAKFLRGEVKKIKDLSFK